MQYNNNLTQLWTSEVKQSFKLFIYCILFYIGAFRVQSTRKALQKNQIKKLKQNIVNMYTHFLASPHVSLTTRWLAYALRRPISKCVVVPPHDYSYFTIFKKPQVIALQTLTKQCVIWPLGFLKPLPLFNALQRGQMVKITMRYHAALSRSHMFFSVCLLAAHICICIGCKIYCISHL